MTTNDKTGIASLIPITPMAGIPLWRQTILLHGEPKIGKTTWASGFKDALYFDAEQGTIGIDVPTFENLLPDRDRINTPISEWSDVLKATSQLEQAKGKNLEGTIIIDTAQAAFDMSRKHTLANNGWSHETDGAYGKGWRAVKDDFAAWVTRIKAIGFGIVFISHTKEVEIETPTSKFTKKTPRLDTGPNDIIMPFVNLIMYAEIMHMGGKDLRVVHTKPSNTISAGERGKVTKLQPLLPFDFDAVNRNWNGEAIDLNQWFGFSASSEPARSPALSMVGANQSAGATPVGSNGKSQSGADRLKQAFDAKDVLPNQ